MEMADLRQAAQQALELRRLADKFSEGWHDGIKIDASDVMLLAEVAAALEHPEQEGLNREMPEWMDYDPATDVLTIHGRRYSAAMFGEQGFLSPVGTLLQVAEGQPDCVTLMTVAALEQPGQEPVVPPELEAHFRHLDAVLEQAEQAEPMALQKLLHQVIYGDFNADNTDDLKLALAARKDFEALQPRHEWRGLTEEEIYPLYNEPRSDAEMVEFARAVEAALRSKNHE